MKVFQYNSLLGRLIEIRATRKIEALKRKHIRGMSKEEIFKLIKQNYQ